MEPLMGMTEKAKAGRPASLRKILLLFLLLGSTDLPGSDLPDVRTVPRVDISRYMGEWYEIARYPARFQEGCLASGATYTLRPDGEIDVVNRCRNEKDGRTREAKGRAWSVDGETNARLKVSFFWPFRGDYWIIDLGKEYEYSVVATPDRKYLWILGRTPVLEQAVLDGILQRLKEQGFRPEKLLWRRD